MPRPSLEEIFGNAPSAPPQNRPSLEEIFTESVAPSPVVEKKRTILEKVISETPSDHFSWKEDIGRPVARTLKSGVKGLIQIPEMASVPLGMAMDTAAGAMGYNTNFGMSNSDMVGRAIDKATGGLTVPRSDTEKVIDAGSEALAGGGASAAVKSLSKIAPRTAKELLMFAGAGGGGEIGRQADPDGVIAPLAGSLIGAVAGGATADPSQVARSVGRGLGNMLRVNKNSVIKSGEAGIPLMLGDVSESSVVKRAQNVLGDTPISSWLIEKGKNKVSKSLEQGLNKAGFEKNLDQVVGGNVARDGLKNYTSKAKNFFDRQYDKFDAIHFPGDTRIPVDSTLSKIREINSRAKTPEALSVYLGNTEKNVMDKILSAAADSGDLSHGDLKLFRTAIGKKLDDYTIGSSEKGVLRELYGSVTQDLRQAAGNKSDKALKTFDRLNNLYSAYRTKVDDVVSPLLNKGEVSQILTSIRGNVKLPEKTASVMMALPGSKRSIVRGAVIREMGVVRTKAGGGEFDVGKFATEFRKLDKSSQNAILTGMKPSAKKDFMNVVDSAAAAYNTSLHSNPSGTAKNTLLLASATGMYTNPVITATMLGSGALTAKMMSNQGFIRWLAGATKGGMKSKSYINSLRSVAEKNPDIADDISDYIKSISGSSVMGSSGSYGQ